MKKTLALTFCLLMMICVSASSVFADSLTLTSTNGNSSWNGFTPGPYSANLTQGTTTTPITMACISFDRRVSVGQTWGVTVNSISAQGVANAMYGTQTDALVKYQQAAWLFNQMLINPAARGDIQGAMWNLFNPTATPDTAGSNQWLQQARIADFSNFDFTRFIILSPLDRGIHGPQENIGVSPVPEPATMLLLGTGLAGVAARMRKRKSDEQETAS